MNKWVNKFCGVLYGLLIPIGLYSKMENTGHEKEEAAEVVHLWNCTTPETVCVCVWGGIFKCIVYILLLTRRKKVFWRLKAEDRNRAVIMVSVVHQTCRLASPFRRLEVKVAFLIKGPFTSKSIFFPHTCCAFYPSRLFWCWLPTVPHPLVGLSLHIPVQILCSSVRSV